MKRRKFKTAHEVNEERKSQSRKRKEEMTKK